MEHSDTAIKRLDRLIEEAELDLQIEERTSRWNYYKDHRDRVLKATRNILTAEEDVTMEEFDAWIFKVRTRSRYFGHSFKPSKPGPIQLKIGGTKPKNDVPKYPFYAEREVVQTLRGTRIEIKKAFLAAFNEDIKVESSHYA